MRWSGTTPVTSSAAPTTLTPGGSPYTYQNTTAGGQMLLITGGVVTTISYSRDGTNFTLIGLLAGQVTVLKGDYVRIVYVTVPTITVFNTTNF